MTPRITLPSDQEVLDVLATLRTSSLKPVSASALATELGLSNPTFWRHFRDIAQQVADARRAHLRGGTDVKRELRGPDSQPSDPAHRLRRELKQTQDRLELAIAHIQRLTLENDRLQNTLHDHGSVTRIASTRS